MQKTVFVSGSSRGIGLAIAKSFGQCGYNVVFHCKNNLALCHEAAAQCKGRTLVARGDLSKIEDVQRVAHEACAAFGGVDILINNAGVGDIRMLQDVTLADYHRVMDTNFSGAVFLTQALLPHMIAKKWGRIINISSMWADMGASCETIYSASKSALEGFTRALAREVGLSAVTANAVAVGYVDTDINAELDASTRQELCAATALGSAVTTADVAAACRFLASDEARAITGQVLRVDCGMNI